MHPQSQDTDDKTFSRMSMGQKTTTDFQEWTDFALTSRAVKAEPYWLHLAVSSPGENTGELYQCTRAPNGVFVVQSDSVSEKLILTDKSRAAMLGYIQRKYMDDMDPESWYSMTEASSDDD